MADKSQLNHPRVEVLSDGTRAVLRFDVHQRLQHGVMALSFILLVLTGWPLTTHGVGASQGLVDLFGGLENVSLGHRVAAVGLIVAAVYHLLYLITQIARRKMTFSMLPTPKDLRDMLGNINYFFGLRRERPKFPRFTYFEKFDYWAVFWGVFIMVGSGFVRWFPDATMKFAPTWLYDVAYYAHADEALLAGLAIFIWHFYNVHLRPGIFPMSWVFLNGRLTLEEFEHEHGEEYEKMFGTKGSGRKED
jgi:cytochrome b subunit of formate dehydrogenase